MIVRGIFVKQSSLKNLEEKLLDPRIRKCPDELTLLLADEFTEIGSSGKIYTKQSVIEGMLRDTQVSHYVIFNFKQLILAPDVVLVTYQLNRCNQNIKEAVCCSLRSSIWKIVDNQWRMVFHQGTLLKNEEL